MKFLLAIGVLAVLGVLCELAWRDVTRACAPGRWEKVRVKQAWQYRNGAWVEILPTPDVYQWIKEQPK